MKSSNISLSYCPFSKLLQSAGVNLSANLICVVFVVRGFLTGSTDTSLWTVYNKGLRNYCGNTLPDGIVSIRSATFSLCVNNFVFDLMPYLFVTGMVKNQKLLANILTPTTKAEDHDVPVTPDEV